MTTLVDARTTRRGFLCSVGLTALFAGADHAFGRSIAGALPWEADAANPPRPVLPGDWAFFTQPEVLTMEAIVDRLVPDDELSMGGRQAGCVVYLDRQLAGYFGTSSRLYTKGPFLPGLPTQGYQGSQSPDARYRAGLQALNEWVSSTRNGKRFEQLAEEDQDAILQDLDTGKIDLPGGIDGRSFFNLILSGTMEGFFADPIYGGNKNMTSWKMIGFPGARYDYRDHVSKHNQPYPHPPVSIAGAVDWSRQ